ncbi:sialin-like isoform X1 [Branchiostoma floridae]|uniref:Sialin-like isoform X1 n=1 Tax=Branchiostoma floridae TaxID=7739 RepID=A0A9J7LIS8_BRAFL|nr:sialin-like isoform X1 [Branchiostoma floridae]
MSFVIYCTVYLAELWKMGTTEKDVTPSDAGGKTETKSERDSEKGSCCLLADKIPARYVLAALFFVGHISMTISRGGFALAVVVMVNSSSRVTPVNQTNTYQLCPSSGPGNASTQNDQGELDWSESIKGVILGAFFYGYIFTQVVGGLLEQKFGCKIVYGTSTLLGTVLSVLSPVASRTSPWAIFAVRFCMGLVSGVLFPCLYGIWGRWAPPTERTKLLAICYIGLPLGNIINYPLSSFLAAQLGWEYIFYIPGASAAVWLVLWFLLGYDSPAQHPRILEEEKKYIEEGIGTNKRQKPKVPWLKVLTSPPVWALVMGQFSSNWGVFFLTTQLPNYMQNVLGFNIQTNGLLSALPFAVAMVCMFASSAAADRLIQGGKIPKVWIRRGFVITGYTGMVICGVILANLSGCNPAAAVSLLCITQGFNSLTVAGFRAVHVEFAPRFSGVTFALANTGGTVSGIFAPLLVGLITDNYPTPAAWSTIFYIGAAIQGVGGIFTAVFLRTDVQPWARGEGDKGSFDKNVELAGSKDLVIANEHAEMPTKVVEMQNTKL